jgi:hypothetical protein
MPIFKTNNCTFGPISYPGPSMKYAIKQQGKVFLVLNKLNAKARRRMGEWIYRSTYS